MVTDSVHDQATKSARAALGQPLAGKRGEWRMPTRRDAEPVAPNLRICFSEKAAHAAELVIAVLSQLLG